MGVYLTTFRTEHKVATFGGSTVNVYAYRYLCKAQDVDDWANPWGKKSARLLRLQCERAQERFDRLKPVYVTDVFKNRWEGIVYANPKGACHYDTESLTKEPVGFLKQVGKRWVITGERHGEDSSMHCGLTVRRAYVERVAAGVPYSLTVKSHTFSNGVVFTPAQFEEWLAKATPEYLAACQKARDDQAAREHLAYLQRLSLNCAAL